MIVGVLLLVIMKPIRDMVLHLQKLILLVLLVLLALSFLYIAWILAQFLWLAYIFPIHGDPEMFFAAGRGILNGLPLYSDLYETKPPGIFLITALSLLWDGDNSLYQIIYAIAAISIPASVAVFCWKITAHQQLNIRLFATLLALVYCGAITTYAVYLSHGFQTEVFGSAFGVMFVVILASARGCFSRKQTIASAICLLGALGLKEPFLFSIFAATILLTDNFRLLVRNFFIPLVISLVVGIMIAAVFGWLGPYMEVYLPDILSGRLPTTRTYLLQSRDILIAANNPLWIRGFSFMNLFGSLEWGSAFPLVRYAIAGLWIAYPFTRTNKMRPALIASTTIVAGGWLIHRAYHYFQLLAMLQFHIPWQDGFFLVLSFTNASILIGICIALFLLARWDRVSAGSTLRAISAIYITTIAAAVTGELPWHNVFAVPVLVAPFLAFIRKFDQHKSKFTVLGIALAVFLIFSSFFVNNRAAPEAWADLQSETQQDWDNNRKHTAETIDALMDNCGYDRFFPWGGYVSGYMRHSPYHLPYAELRAFGEGANLYFQRKYFDDLNKTPIVIAVKTAQVLVEQGGIIPSSLDPRVKAIVKNNFTKSSPACAEPFLPLPNDDFSVYFRREKL
jgi:hypothetical protein